MSVCGWGCCLADRHPATGRYGTALRIGKIAPPSAEAPRRSGRMRTLANFRGLLQGWRSSFLPASVGGRTASPPSKIQSLADVTTRWGNCSSGVGHGGVKKPVSDRPRQMETTWLEENRLCLWHKRTCLATSLGISESPRKSYPQTSCLGGTPPCSLNARPASQDPPRGVSF